MPNQTFYKVFVGNNAPFPGGGFGVPQPAQKTGPKKEDIQDGLSSTILVTESNFPVFWAQPGGDNNFNPNPRGGYQPFMLGLPHGNNSCLVLMFDGTVRRVTSKTDPMNLQAAITPRGKENLPDDWAKKE